MAKVPNTTDFSQQDVTNVVGYDNLNDCFLNAVSGYFDSNYSGGKNSLYNFRNYGPPDVTGPLITENPYPGYTFRGISIFVSENGYNLYILGIHSGDISGYNRVLRYVMSSPHNLNTATYHSYYLLTTTEPTTGLSRHTLYFTTDGMKFIIGKGIHTSEDAGYAIEIYTLNSAWNISSGVTRYHTTLVRRQSFVHINYTFAFSDNYMLGGDKRSSDNSAATTYVPINLNTLDTNSIYILSYAPWVTTPPLKNPYVMRMDWSNQFVYFGVKADSGGWGIYRNNILNNATSGKRVGDEFTLITNNPSGAFLYLADFHRTLSGYYYALENNTTGFPGVVAF